MSLKKALSRSRRNQSGQVHKSAHKLRIQVAHKAGQISEEINMKLPECIYKKCPKKESKVGDLVKTDDGWMHAYPCVQMAETEKRRSKKKVDLDKLERKVRKFR